MKKLKPNINSLLGRLALLSCSTPAQQKNVPFCKNSSRAHRTYTIFLERFSSLGWLSLFFARFFVIRSENQTDNKAVNTISAIIRNHTPLMTGSWDAKSRWVERKTANDQMVLNELTMVNGSRTFRTCAPRESSSPGLGMTNTVLSYSVVDDEYNFVSMRRIALSSPILQF